MSPMPGIFDIVLVSVLFSRPAMANVWPSRSSTSVSVRRVVSAGIRKPSSVIALAKSSALTSGLHLEVDQVAAEHRRREVQPDAELLEHDRDRVAAGARCTTGYGNSPPARKLASLPLVAIRFGSARLWKSPLFCSARNDAAEALFRVEDEQVQEVAEHQPAVFVVADRRANCCVVVRPNQSFL